MIGSTAVIAGRQTDGSVFIGIYDLKAYSPEGVQPSNNTHLSAANVHFNPDSGFITYSARVPLDTPNLAVQPGEQTQLIYAVGNAPTSRNYLFTPCVRARCFVRDLVILIIATELDIHRTVGSTPLTFTSNDETDTDIKSDAMKSGSVASPANAQRSFALPTKPRCIHCFFTCITTMAIIMSHVFLIL